LDAAGLSEDTANAQIAANDSNNGLSEPLSQGQLPTVSQEQSQPDALADHF
jgi:hypothetical protein